MMQAGRDYVTRVIGAIRSLRRPKTVRKAAAPENPKPVAPARRGIVRK